MMDELQQDFNSLEMALRSRDLKEKGLNNIFKDLHNQVNEQKSIISMLTAENRELHGTVKNKEREHKLLEDQIYEFVDDISASEKQLASQKDQVERLDYQRRELENRLVAIEAEKLELEDQLLKSVGAGEVGWGAGGVGGVRGRAGMAVRRWSVPRSCARSTPTSRKTSSA
jgi:archaellum component FlaC